MANRNITLSMPEDLIRRAKVLAAQRDTSISALVAQQLEQLTGTTRDYDAAWRAEEELMEQGAGLQVGKIAWTRDELHTR